MGTSKTAGSAQKAGSQKRTAIKSTATWSVQEQRQLHIRTELNVQWEDFIDYQLKDAESEIIATLPRNCMFDDSTYRSAWRSLRAGLRVVASSINWYAEQYGVAEDVFDDVIVADDLISNESEAYPEAQRPPSRDDIQSGTDTDEELSSSLVMPNSLIRDARTSAGKFMNLVSSILIDYSNIMLIPCFGTNRFKYGKSVLTSRNDQRVIFYSLSEEQHGPEMAGLGRCGAEDRDDDDLDLNEYKRRIKIQVAGQMLSTAIQRGRGHRQKALLGDPRYKTVYYLVFTGRSVTLAAAHITDCYIARMRQNRLRPKDEMTVKWSKRFNLSNQEELLEALKMVLTLTFYLLELWHTVRDCWNIARRR